MRSPDSIMVLRILDAADYALTVDELKTRMRRMDHHATPDKVRDRLCKLKSKGLTVCYRMRPVYAWDITLRGQAALSKAMEGA